MDRRHFLTLTAGAAALPFAAKAASLDYTPGLVAQHLKAGDTVFLGFTADWCSTCAAQQRAIRKLKSQNAAYGENITFITVDWDDANKADLVAQLNIPRRSTLVVLKGDQELGRVIAQTQTSAIKVLMDKALGAATA